MLIAERFISGLVKIHGKHVVSTDGGTWNLIPNGLQVPKTKTPYQFFFFGKEKKSLIERTMQYIKE